MAMSMRLLALPRTANLLRVFHLSTPQNGLFINRLSNNPSCSTKRLMSILDTYVEKTEKKEKSPFVNPLRQPKLKETSTDDLEILLSKYDSTDINDLPVEDLPNPYEKPQRKCILCEHNVDLDYKNTRLLSQFVSPHTGQIYGRQITGLCIYMQKRVANLIKRARFFGFMPYIYKEPKFLEDPKLFDPFKRVN